MTTDGDARSKWVNDNIESGLTADGFDEAIIGISERCGRAPIVAYDRDKCIDILVERDGMTYEEAEDFFGFNGIGSWMGEETPEFITLYHED